jgi:hypothetical protein
VAPPPPLRRANPAVTPALESLVQHCLEPDPARRYQSAQQLLDDLKRQRHHRSLQYAREPSLRERARKWVRRHPRLTAPASVAAIATVLLAVGVAPFAWAAWSRANHEAESARQREELAQTRAELADKNAAAAKERTLRAAEDALREFRELDSHTMLWRRLLVLANVVRLNPADQTGLDDSLADAIQQCRRSGLYRLVDNPDWQTTSMVRHLPDSERDRLRNSADRLLFTLANALSVGGKPDVEALARLRKLREALHGDRDYYLAACEAVADGDVPLAVKVLTANPSSPTYRAEAQFLLGLCYQKQADYLQAKASFDDSTEGVRRVLGPRALARLSSIRLERALRCAKLGDRTAAVAEAELLIQFEPTPMRHYQAASVYAASIRALHAGKVSGGNPGRTASLLPFDKTRAFQLLSFALRHGYGTELRPVDKGVGQTVAYRFQLDPALQALWAFDEFRRLATGLQILGSGDPPRMRPFEVTR